MRAWKDDLIQETEQTKENVPDREKMVKVKPLPGVREELKLCGVGFKNGPQWFSCPALFTPVSFSSTLIRTDLCNKKDNAELVQYVTSEAPSWKTLSLMSCFLGSLALWEAALHEKERSMWWGTNPDRQPTPTPMCQPDSEPSATLQTQLNLQMTVIQMDIWTITSWKTLSKSHPGKTLPKSCLSENARLNTTYCFKTWFWDNLSLVIYNYYEW